MTQTTAVGALSQDKRIMKTKKKATLTLKCSRNKKRKGMGLDARSTIMASEKQSF